MGSESHQKSDHGITDVRPGVAAIIYDAEGRVLLHHRRVGDGWAPVSRHVERGETVAAALHREVREETGLAVRIERLVSLSSDPAFQVVGFPDGRRTGGRLRGSDEGRAWSWFAADALPKPLLPYARVWLADAASADPGPAIR